MTLQFNQKEQSFHWGIDKNSPEWITIIENCSERESCILKAYANTKSNNLTIDFLKKCVDELRTFRDNLHAERIYFLLDCF